MSAATATRSLWRPRANLFQRRPGIRHQSTTQRASEATSDAGAKARETAAGVTSKASSGLSRVSSSAGPVVSSAAAGLGRAISGIGGRTGRFINGVQSLIPPTRYYSSVALEISKLVFQGQKMSPPSWPTIQSYFNPILKASRNPRAFQQTLNEAVPNPTPETLLQRVRNLSRAQVATGAVVAAEVLGFFTVGEMIGRFKIIGYRGGVNHGEH